jgi:TetR/AcrR family transcriptional repressor of nem operon
VRYPSGHREQTHARILRAAAELFRAEGIAATGVDRVMARAGLTAGGFYAHFRSKDALVASAVDAAAEASRERWFGRFDELRGETWARAFVETYLSEAHRDDRSGGCILPSLGAEVGHAGRSARLRFEQRLRGMLDFIQAQMRSELSADRQDVIAAIATCVGGLLLARAVPSPELSTKILASAEAGAKRLLGLEPARPARRKPRPRRSGNSA